MIKGTKSAVRKVRKITDIASGLPVATLPCSCGATGVKIHDDDRDMVRCPKCGKVEHHGIRGATLRVYRDWETETKNVWACMCPVELEAEIEAAKVKPDKDRTDKEKVLAAVEVEPDPEPEPEPEPKSAACNTLNETYLG